VSVCVAPSIVRRRRDGLCRDLRQWGRGKEQLKWDGNARGPRSSCMGVTWKREAMQVLTILVSSTQECPLHRARVMKAVLRGLFGVQRDARVQVDRWRWRGRQIDRTDHVSVTPPKGARKADRFAEDIGAVPGGVKREEPTQRRADEARVLRTNAGS